MSCRLGLPLRERFRDFKQGRADAFRGLPRHIGEFASDHHIDDLADACFGPVNGVHIAAITKGRDAVGDVQDLLDAMRDINDGNPLLLETSNQIKKPLSLTMVREELARP